MSKPFPVPTWPYLRSGYLTRGKTLAELAAKCGIDPQALEQTVAEFNRHARSARTRSSTAGVTAFNRASGDPEHQPNPSLAPLEKGPFYAIKVLPGSFGTFFGLRADADARVLDAAGDPIPGLYVAGSDQANVMGGHYPSGGINIGPAMTFGYIAARKHRRSAGLRERRPAVAERRRLRTGSAFLWHPMNTLCVLNNDSGVVRSEQELFGGPPSDQSSTMRRGWMRKPSHSRIASRRLALRTAYLAVS